MNGPAPTCREVLEQIYALIDCEECDRRGALIDGGDIDGPDARLRALMLAHAASCAQCSDALEAERHVRALLRRCYGTAQVPAALRARVTASITRISVAYRG